ncbi:asialoglycoprotein receptor 1 isoform X1 [Pelodiscus sinensis]|uniref:asialoglycoprotein receptor 1 isoform X1 n=1 Tax=Pelodiscus sinensis TaxID=13735 RepID=UPI003F6B8DFE
MAKDYEDFQALDVEEESGVPLSKVFLPQFTGWQRLCVSPWSVCALLALILGLIFGIIALAVSSSQQGAEQRDLQGALGSLNRSLNSELMELARNVHTLEDKLTQVASSLDQAKENSIQAQQRLEEQVGILRDSLNSLNCDLLEMKSNESQPGCCPRDWEHFGESCYWFSRDQKTWDESNLYCKAQDSHLVIINTRAEQLYVQRRTVPLYTWIGLTDTSGQWRWVDGTIYTMNSRDWSPGQPDDYTEHGLGGGEDCVMYHYDGRWNDDHCSRLYHWAWTGGQASLMTTVAMDSGAGRIARTCMTTGCGTMNTAPGATAGCARRS